MSHSVKLVFVGSNRVRLRYADSVTRAPNLKPFVSIKGVKRVEYNKVTKSLLIVFDHHVVSKKELLNFLATLGLEIREELEEHDYLGEGNALSDSIFSSMREVNRDLKIKTRGKADIASLAPTALMALSAVQLFRRPVMPRWYDMAWWAVNMYHWQYVHYRAQAKSEEEIVAEADEAEEVT